MKQKLKTLARGILLSLIILCLIFGICFLLASFYECSFNPCGWKENTKSWVIGPFLVIGGINIIGMFVFFQLKDEV